MMLDKIITLPPGGGRRYEMGKLTALFKADEADTDAKYSVSEWVLEPGRKVSAHIATRPMKRSSLSSTELLNCCSTGIGRGSLQDRSCGSPRG